jgi:plastocyanin
MRSRSSSVVAASIAALSLAALLFGCSSKDSTSPPVTVTGPTFNFTFPQTGTSHELVFTDVGTWNYVCTTHAPGMAGSVTVAAAGPDSVLVHVGPSNSLSFSPASASVKTGGKVRWVNDSNMSNHTVTR